VHIATEGPLGWGARAWCLKRKIAFTTSCHTRFPEYIRLRAPIPLSWTYAWLRRFHGAATRTLVRSQTQYDDFIARGFQNLAIWPGGVDTQLFRPRPKTGEFPGHVAMYVGRVAAEKSIEDFLAAPFVGTKVVVGDGPSRASLEKHYPEAIFTGFRHGEALAETVSEADVFVFPSRTDTLGLVMLEAMAAGVPVAAYPVPGPLDVVKSGQTGVLHDDLSEAMRQALSIDPKACRHYAEAFSWKACSDRFLALLQPLDPDDLSMRAEERRMSAPLGAHASPLNQA
jgi:glycosyltransferase involved in cell wall biosynthesis